MKFISIETFSSRQTAPLKIAKYRTHNPYDKAMILLILYRKQAYCIAGSRENTSIH